MLTIEKKIELIKIANDMVKSKREAKDWVQWGEGDYLSEFSFILESLIKTVTEELN